MNVKIYTLYSAIGGVIWISSVTIAGYFLGQITFVKDNLDFIVIGAVVIVICATAFPAIAHWLHGRRQSRPVVTDAPQDVAQENTVLEKAVLETTVVEKSAAEKTAE